MPRFPQLHPRTTPLTVVSNRGPGRRGRVTAALTWIRTRAIRRRPLLTLIRSSDDHPAAVENSPPPAPPSSHREPQLPVAPVRAIGIAGAETRIAPTMLGMRELAWSPHPDRSFRPGSHPTTPAEPEQ